MNRLLCGNNHHTCILQLHFESYCVVPPRTSSTTLDPRGSLFPPQEVCIWMLRGWPLILEAERGKDNLNLRTEQTPKRAPLSQTASFEL
ncbi:hypothetical protein TNCV_3750121 [Trichonephila clavipes]|nr:hypothetical protein TNCV_3750121 [Trichonephila clavipes]